jgi:hypothetical protein
MLDELHEVAQILFNDPGYFRDPAFSGGERHREGDVSDKPVNPSDLIVRLDAAREGLHHLASEQPASLSLSGILRLLFEPETSEGETPGASGDEDLDEGQVPDTLPTPSPPPPKAQQLRRGSANGWRHRSTRSSRLWHRNRLLSAALPRRWCRQSRSPWRLPFGDVAKAGFPANSPSDGLTEFFRSCSAVQ